MGTPCWDELWDIASILEVVYIYICLPFPVYRVVYDYFNRMILDITFLFIGNMSHFGGFGTSHHLKKYLLEMISRVG